MVVASPSALLDRTEDCAAGLPSMIQDGSIGRGVRLTARLAISISVRDINNLKRVRAKIGLRCKGMQPGDAPRQARNKLLSLRYGPRCNPSQPSRVWRQFVAFHAVYFLFVSGSADPISAFRKLTMIRPLRLVSPSLDDSARPRPRAAKPVAISTGSAGIFLPSSSNNLVTSAPKARRCLRLRSL